MASQRSLSFVADPSSVTVASGKTVSGLISLSVGNLQANSHITKIAISYTTNATVQLKDSTSSTKHSTTGAKSDSYVITDGWKSLTDTSWASSNYSLTIRFGKGSTSGSVTVRDIRYDVYYYVDTSPVTAPSNASLGSSIAQTTSVLSWSAGLDGQANSVTGYQIQRRNNTSANFDNIDWSDYVTTGNITNYDVQPCGERGSYTQYRVRTLGQAGQSYYSQYVVAEGVLQRNTLPGAPSVDESIPSVFQDPNITLKWSKPNDSTGEVIGYKIYMGASEDDEIPDYSQIADVKSSQTNVSYLAYVQVERGRYVGFAVCAYDQFGAKGQLSSFPVVRRNTAPVMPDTISSNTNLFSSGSISLEWGQAVDDTDQVAGYILQTRHGFDNNIGSWVASDLGLSQSTSVSPSYSGGQRVDFRVKAYDTFGAYSDYTHYISVRINKDPEVGSGFEVIPENYSKSDPTIYESGNINLRWYASSSEYSVIDHYCYGYSFSSDGVNYGNQVLSGNITSCNAIASFGLSTFNRGYKARFRLYAYDQTGRKSMYDKECYIVRNVVPGKPQLLYPNSGIHYEKPILIISVPKADNSINRSIRIANGSSDQYVYNIGIKKRQISARLQDNVSSSISISIQDQFGVQSEVLSVSIECAAPEWTRQIGPGTIIANTSISHRADLNEMLQQVNVSRNAYGMQDAEFSESVGYFANWITNAKDIYNGIAQVYEKLGMSYDSFPAYTNSYPQASIINFLRMMIEGV